MVVRYMIAACAGALIAATPARAGNAPLAEIKASEANEAGVNVTVPTGGCTSKTDFEVSTHAGAAGITDVEFRRLNQDTCKGNFPEGVKLQFTWGDLKVPAGTKVAVKNPVETAHKVALVSTPKSAKLKKKKKVVKRCLRSKHRKHGCVTHRARHHARHLHRHHRRHHHHCCACH